MMIHARTHRHAQLVGIALALSCIGMIVLDLGDTSVAAATEVPAATDRASPDSGPSIDTHSAYTTYHCASQHVFCIDANGNPLPDPDTTDGGGEETPQNAAADDHILVYVIDRPTNASGMTLELSSAGAVAPSKATFGPPGCDAGAEDGGTPADATVLLTLQIVMPPSSISIQFTRTNACSRAVERSSTYTVGLTQSSRTYFEPALFIPVVFDGTRTIDAVGVPGTNEQALHAKVDDYIAAGIALNYFPWGVPQNGPSGGAWIVPPRRCKDPASVACGLRFLRHYLIEPLGLQVGTNLSDDGLAGKAFEQWYLGLTYEPIAGGSISVGIAFIQGAFFTPGYAEGMILPPNATGVPSDAYEVKYMVRPYVAVTISPAIFTTIINAISDVGRKSQSISTE